MNTRASVHTGAIPVLTPTAAPPGQPDTAPAGGSTEGSARRAVVASLQGLPVGYRVLHDVEISAFHAGVDHVVVGPTGIFAIVFMQSDDRLRIVDHPNRRRRRNDIGKECEAARWQAGAVGSVLQHAVVPIVCVVDSAIRMPVLHVGHVVVCRISALAGYIVDGPHCLDDTAIRFFGDRSAVHAGHSTRRSLAIAAPSYAATLSPRAAKGPRHPRVKRTDKDGSRRGIGWRLLSIALGIAVFVLALQVVSFVSNAATKNAPRAQTSGTQAAVAPRTTAPVTHPSTSTVAASANSGPTPVLGSTANSLIDDTLPPDPNAPTSSTVAPTVAVPSTVTPVTDELLPTLSFACPAPGGGWKASAVATEFKADELGYFLWYQVAGGEWTFWGQFKSGSTAPLPLGPIAQSTDVNVRMDRTLHADSGSAPTMLTFTSPDTPC